MEDDDGATGDHHGIGDFNRGDGLAGPASATARGRIPAPASTADATNGDLVGTERHMPILFGRMAMVEVGTVL
jgi:hypothetical protein